MFTSTLMFQTMTAHMTVSGQVWKDWWPVTSMHEGQQARSLAQLAGNSGVQSLDLPQAARGHGTGARSAAYVAPSVLSGGLCHLSTGCRRPQLGRDSKGDKSPGYAKELAAITAKVLPFEQRCTVSLFCTATVSMLPCCAAWATV